MYRLTTITLTTVGILCLAVALPVGDAVAQQKQRVSYKMSAESSKYTQQHVIEVDDVPGHQVRVFEIYRTFPNNAPMINGVKLKEMWTRGLSDYIDGNGSNTGHNVFVLENGDKFYARTTTLAQSPGSGKLTTAGAGPITGGTGKLAGIQGMIRTSGTAEPKAAWSRRSTKSSTGLQSSRQAVSTDVRCLRRHRCHLKPLPLGFGRAWSTCNAQVRVAFASGSAFQKKATR
jgi:hypothetical protein